MFSNLQPVMLGGLFYLLCSNSGILYVGVGSFCELSVAITVCIHSSLLVCMWERHSSGVFSAEPGRSRGV